MSLDKKYLKLLSEKYPNQLTVSTKIVSLSSILNLTKGAEIFISDVHGEHEAFQHVMRNGSGVIKQKIKDLFTEELSEKDIAQLATLIYYPKEKLELIKKDSENIKEFYRKTIFRLIQLTRGFASIYASKKLQSLLPSGFNEIITELVAERDLGEENDYYEHLINSIIEIEQSDNLIIQLSFFIQKLAIHKVHIIGDVYDRGPGAEIIMDELMNHYSVDFQWGNHDIVWMGAACGSETCIANVLRLSLRYANTNTLERGYGINLMPLASFALEYYKNDDSIIFNPKVAPDEIHSSSEEWLNRLMHKAISIIQFKLEHQLVKRRPEFGMNDRLFMSEIDLKNGHVQIEGKTYPLKDHYFPTLENGYLTKLHPEERFLMDLLVESFQKSTKLQAHANFLFEKGAMYKVTNKNLLYHGCIPLNSNGLLKEVRIDHQVYKGKELMDYFDKQVKLAFSARDSSEEKKKGVDILWYLWAGPDSPIFGKHKMATFERYFIDDRSIQKEQKNYYYTYRDNAETCKMILEEFGLGPDAVILNGHVPVSVKEGESPIKGAGRLVVIDGGFSKAYQDQTGIAGFTLMHNCYGRQLIAHEAFDSQKVAIAEEKDVAYSEVFLDQSETKQRIRDVDDGQIIKERIDDLKELLEAYRSGELKEKTV
ncbi:fructose-1,6-bisphosphatase-3 [Marivirga sericea]|uniref:Fructose-1,6-bisphosphatase class 3 n=1 Tax=Marivirga sericea TaxID=1028 RepID=A0A1X7KFV3_9BACT|nr:fructose-1,6-bisphosphatase [Marivirga sericea]SMG39896.1 fructose-1,6-bisphosphatase-3 [Marivirga sericea]